MRVMYVHSFGGTCNVVPRDLLYLLCSLNPRNMLCADSPPSRNSHKHTTSTSPHTHRPILPPLGKIPILYPHPLHSRRPSSSSPLFTGVVPSFLLLLLFGRSSNKARAAVPMPAVGLVVDLDDGLARGGDDAARVEHHARDGIVVGVGVVDGAGAEVPDLRRVSQPVEFSIPWSSENEENKVRKKSWGRGGGGACPTLILRSRLPVTRWTSSN